MTDLALLRRQVTHSTVHSGSFLALLAALAAWRMPAIETWPRAVDFAKTSVAKVLFAMAVAAVVMAGGRGWELSLAIGAAIGACSFAGRYRPWALTAATIAVLAVNPGWFDVSATKAIARLEELGGSLYPVHLVALAVVFAMSAGLLMLVPRLKTTVIVRRPVLSLLSLYATLLLLAAAGLVSGWPQLMLWALTATLGAYLWFLAYGIIDTARGQTPPLTPLGAFHAPWNWSSVPFGKGAAYLRKFEAKDADELAVTQLKGIKLLTWALILKAALIAFQKSVHGVLGLPTFQEAFAAQLASTPLPVAVCWACLIAGFFEALLLIASWGHAVIAIARIAGYRLLRNTHRPLSSRTLAEFWNRYFYYFKELLVDLFFYPAYLRWFRKYPRLRLAFATFVAAGLGNALFHFIRDIGAVAEHGLVQAVIGYQTYAFYCVVLAAGIAASQVRGWKPPENAGLFRRQIWPSMCVALFFSLLHVFDDMGRETTLADHLYFMFRLFGIDLIWS